MQRDFHNRDFEQFLKQNADQYRMFPSEKVWQGIDKTLHTRRRWYGLGLAFLLMLTGAAVTWVMVTTSSSKKESFADILHSPDDLIKSERKSILPVVDENPAAASRKADRELLNISIPGSVSLFDEPVEKATAIKTATPEVFSQERQATASSNHTTVPATLVATTPQKGIVAETLTEQVKLMIITSPVGQNVRDDNFTENDVAVKNEVATLPRSQNDIYPLSIESVLNSYTSPARKRNISLQFYIAPTISYRKLSENKEFLKDAAARGVIPSYAAFTDINNYVDHKPDMGLELGLSGRYALSNSFNLRAGLQFNVSRYDIRAYEHHSEVATIALDAGRPNTSISRMTSYRNFSGGDANWLKNLYYSASMPIGAEFLFKSSTPTRFGIAATIQPTYIIRDRAFLISTDYRNYVEEPSLVRRWNMNTSLETFANIPVGGALFQVGPRVRYQIKSSFVDKYPVKENLFDFGFKVGIQLKQ